MISFMAKVWRKKEKIINLLWGVLTVYGRKKSECRRWEGDGERFRKIREVSGGKQSLSNTVTGHCGDRAVVTVLVDRHIVIFISPTTCLPSPKSFLLDHSHVVQLSLRSAFHLCGRGAGEQEGATPGPVLHLTSHGSYSPRNPQFSPRCTANLKAPQRGVTGRGAVLLLRLYYRKVESWRDSAIYERKWNLVPAP